MKPTTRHQFGFLRQLATRDIFKRLPFRFEPRDAVRITKDYSGRWEGTLTDIYYGSTKLYPTILHGDFAMLSGFEYIARQIRLIARYVRRMGATSILELGAGNGLNLLALAVLCPAVNRLVGVELTQQGIMAARTLLGNPPIKALSRICEVTEDEVAQRLAMVRPEYLQGDIKELPQEANSFEFVYSVFVIEQMPRDYMQAFREAFRVTNSHALFVEAFQEAQEGLANRIWLWSWDYFCKSIRVVELAGFTIEEYVPLEFKKFTHGGGAVLCAKSTLP